MLGAVVSADCTVDPCSCYCREGAKHMSVKTLSSIAMPSQGFLAGLLEGVLTNASNSDRCSRPAALHSLQVLLSTRIPGLSVKALWCDDLTVPLLIDMSKEAQESLSATLNTFVQGWQVDTMSGSQTSMPLI